MINKLIHVKCLMVDMTDNQFHLRDCMYYLMSTEHGLFLMVDLHDGAPEYLIHPINGKCLIYTSHR